MVRRRRTTRRRSGPRNRTRINMRSMQAGVQRVKRGIVTIARSIPSDPPPLRSACTRTGIIRFTLYYKQVAQRISASGPGYGKFLSTSEYFNPTAVALQSNDVVKEIYRQLMGWEPSKTVSEVMSYNILGIRIWAGTRVENVYLSLHTHAHNYPPIVVTDRAGKNHRARVKIAPPLPFWQDSNVANHNVCLYNYLLTLDMLKEEQSDTAEAKWDAANASEVLTIDLSIEYQLHGVLSATVSKAISSISGEKSLN